LLLEDVARESAASAHLARGGDLEALLRPGVGLHLGHGGGLVKQTLTRVPAPAYLPPTGRIGQPPDGSGWTAAPGSGRVGRGGRGLGRGGRSLSRRLRLGR